MTEKQVSELPEALSLTNTDVFVIEQGGIAKKVTAETLKENFSISPGDPESTGDVLISAIDFSRWEDGEFDVTYSNDIFESGSVVFDEDNRPKRITLGSHVLTLTLPEVE